MLGIGSSRIGGRTLIVAARRRPTVRRN